MRWLLVLALTGIAIGNACDRGAVETKPIASNTTQATGTSKSGDFGDVCSEHGVLEAVCTQCNPKLIPIFQAKGDWCASHGFPASFCPICHPERGGRPAVDVARDDAPADGTKIRFKTKETAHMAGIETVQASERHGDASVVAVARLAYDGTRVAQVNARAPGVLRAIHVDVGTRVQRGTPLVEIESATVGADQSKLAATRARAAVAQAAYERTRTLIDKGIAPANELLVVEQELQAAKADEEATLKVLRMVGQHDEDATYTLLAPLGGIVTQRRHSIGTLVDVEEMLFEIVDPSAMWVEIDVPETDLAVVAVGQPVVVSVDGLAGREITGAIHYIAPAIDPKTRTALARARVANADGMLRANMFGRARILVGESRASVVVPRNALQHAKGVPLVFVRLAADLYETRRVRVGRTHGDLVELAQGVRAGETVVTEGSFLLKTETLKGSIGAGCCEPMAVK